MTEETASTNLPATHKTNGTVMHGESGIWVKSLEVARANRVAFCVYVTLVMAAAIFGDLQSSSTLAYAAGTQVFAAALLAVPAHISVLMNISGLAAIATPIAGTAVTAFVSRGLLLMALSAAPAFAVAYLLSGPATGMGLKIAASYAVTLCSAAVVFAVLGSMLPATVAGTDSGIAASARRGLRSFGYAFPRMLACFGLLATATYACVKVGTAFSAGDAPILLEDEGFDITATAAAFASTVIAAFHVVLTAVILCRAYMRAEGKTAA